MVGWDYWASVCCGEACARESWRRDLRERVMLPHTTLGVQVIDAVPELLNVGLIGGGTEGTPVDLVGALVGWLVSLVGDVGIRSMGRSPYERALSRTLGLANQSGGSAG